MTTPKIFLTDYASYNNGTQFQFGHWVDLTDFSDEDELNHYIREHFEECDEKSPLDNYGSKREETMITDYENFPSEFYSESNMNFEGLYEYLKLTDDEKTKVAFLMSQSCDLKYSIDHHENVYLYEDTSNSKYDLFEMYYPEIEDQTNKCFYLKIDYDLFIKENFTSFEFEGESYLVDDNWNH